MNVFFSLRCSVVTMSVSMTTRERRGLYTSRLKMISQNSPNRLDTHDQFHIFLNPDLSQVALCRAIVAGSVVTLIKQDFVIGEGPV